MYKVPQWVLEKQLKLLQEYEARLIRIRSYSKGFKSSTNKSLKEVQEQIKLLKDNYYV